MCPPYETRRRRMPYKEACLMFREQSFHVRTGHAFLDMTHDLDDGLAVTGVRQGGGSVGNDAHNDQGERRCRHGVCQCSSQAVTHISHMVRRTRR